MAIEVEGQDRKVSTEDLADKISVQDDDKNEDQIQVEGEDELKVKSPESTARSTGDKGQSDREPSAPKDAAITSEDGKALQEAGDKDNSPKKTRARRFGFLSRLFHRSPKTKELQDVEAGTELLSKSGEVGNGASQEDVSAKADAKADAKAEEAAAAGQKNEESPNGKKEKSASQPDLAVQVASDEKDGAGKENGETRDGSKMFTSRFHSVKWRWILSGFVLFFIIFVLAGFLAAQLAYFPPERNDGDNIVPLAVPGCGQVLGVKENGVFVFRGMPYALPPVNDRRWKPSSLPSKVEDCWAGTLFAENISSFCYQQPISGVELDFNEDCLYINVMTPSLSYQNPLPVVVYITGSTLLGLDEHDLSWQPTGQLVKEKGVVFVTFNYRMGLFGFMALDVLGKAVYPPTSGNYGFHDQLTALRWVHKNIRHFGGDPEKVTLLAHGSAATSALALISSKRSKNFFTQAWLTGGSALFTDKNLREVELDNLDFLKNTGCETVSCLQEKHAEDLLSALPERWGLQTPLDLPTADEEPVSAVAVTDGAVLFDQPMTIWKEGDINGVSVVLGSSAQDSSIWTSNKNLEQWGWSEFSSYVTERLDTINSTLSAQILDFYVDNTSVPEAQFHSMVSDLRVTCPLQELAEILPESSEAKAYFYVVNYKPSFPLNFTASTVPMSSHGLDIIAILDLLDQYVPEMSPLDLVYQSTMQDLFYNFVKNGKPSNGNVELKGSGYVNLISDNVISSMAPYKNCKVWEELRSQKFGRIN